MTSYGARAHALRLVVLVGLALMVLAPTAALAQTEDTSYPTTPTSDVAGTTVTVSRDATEVRVAGASASRLPFTGGDVALLTVLGLVAFGSGLAIVVFTRRRSTSAPA
jgi:hypothetical protein